MQTSTGGNVNGGELALRLHYVGGMATREDTKRARSRAAKEWSRKVEDFTTLRLASYYSDAARFELSRIERNEEGARPEYAREQEIIAALWALRWLLCDTKSDDKSMSAWVDGRNQAMAYEARLASKT